MKGKTEITTDEGLTFSNDKYSRCELEGNNDTGRPKVSLSHSKLENPLDPNIPEAKWTLNLWWSGKIKGQPSVWCEYWCWNDDPPFGEELLTSTCPDKLLLEEALAALTNAMPENF